MQHILSQLRAVVGICGRQGVTPGPHRLSKHCLRVPIEDGELLYHNMTGELLELSSEESAVMFDDTGLRDELIARWYLVPEGFDEHQLAQQVRTASRLFTPHTAGDVHFVVFPTSDCNARCFYCYELGRPRRNMTDEVAHDVAAFIVRSAAGRPVRINWFGGEPLYNRRAIDIITSDLAEAGVRLSSQMTTNASLFDEELVRHAVDVWALDSVQVTLDGTEEVYNRAKAYIDIEGSAYQRVLRAIEFLSDAGAHVSIRLNLNGENESDLWDLADELAERFRGRSNLTVYTVLLKDFGFDVRPHESEDRALEAYANLQRHLVDSGIGWRWCPRKHVAENQCMADNDDWLTILPDGRLGKCEHESEDKLVGSIYDDELDSEAIVAWKERVEVPECEGCLFYPTCTRLVQCAWHVGGCTSYDRRMMCANLAQRVLNAYEIHRSGVEISSNDEEMLVPEY